MDVARPGTAHGIPVRAPDARFVRGDCEETARRLLFGSVHGSRHPRPVAVCKYRARRLRFGSVRGSRHPRPVIISAFRARRLLLETFHGSRHPRPGTICAFRARRLLHGSVHESSTARPSHLCQRHDRHSIPSLPTVRHSPSYPHRPPALTRLPTGFERSRPSDPSASPIRPTQRADHNVY